MRITVGPDGGFILSEIYSGVGIATDRGLFGVAQRDDGIEVMLDGKPVWTSHEIARCPSHIGPDDGQHNVYQCVSHEGHDGSHRTVPPLSPNGPGVILPDGSGAFVESRPLSKTHWIYAEGRSEPPMPMRVGLGAKRNELADQIRDSARYAIRASTMNGAEKDFDPDAMVKNMVVGLLGYWTDDGRRGSL